MFMKKIHGVHPSRPRTVFIAVLFAHACYRRAEIHIRLFSLKDFSVDLEGRQSLALSESRAAGGFAYRSGYLDPYVSSSGNLLRAANEAARIRLA
jgi:hypothetical protein